MGQLLGKFKLTLTQVAVVDMLCEETDGLLTCKVCGHTCSIGWESGGDEDTNIEDMKSHILSHKHEFSKAVIEFEEQCKR